jgi:predicted MFS family arabinose efflux permease
VLFTFYPPLAESRGASDLIVGVVGFSFGASRAFTFSLTTRETFRRFLLDERNILTILVGAMAVCALAGLLPVLAGSTVLLGLLSFVVAALANSVAMVICQVELIARAEPQRRGSAAGVFESGIGIGLALGPVLSGFASGGSLSTPFLIIPFGFVAALVAILVLRQREGRRRLP